MTIGAAVLGLATAMPAGAQPQPLRVVTTLSVYASLVQEIGGEHVTVRSIASPREDAHFVRPRPSFARSVRNADLFVTTGLDLELWVPPLLDKASNPRVSEGGVGYVTAYTGIDLLDIPSSVSRSEGDIHLYGNPHVHTDPLRALQVARNITTGLERVEPRRRQVWREGLTRFEDRIHRSLFGDTLVAVLGGPLLEQLALSPNLFSFLESNELDGAPLLDMLGGWLGRAWELRGREIVCYHKNWAYLEDRFGVSCAAYVESRPGIPPTPRHLATLVRWMADEGGRIVLAANYFDQATVGTVARRGDGRAVIVPFYPGGSSEVGSYFDLVDGWVEALTEAVRADSRR